MQGEAEGKAHVAAHVGAPGSVSEEEGERNRDQGRADRAPARIAATGASIAGRRGCSLANDPRWDALANDPSRRGGFSAAEAQAEKAPAQLRR